MLETVSLSEEELGLLFPLASNGGAAKPQNARSSGDAKPLSFPSKHATTLQRKTPKTSNTSKPSRSRAMRRKASEEVSSSISGVVPARCGYRTGKCQNLQAIKRNGTLHKLCELHRERANLNQKKLDRKKRLQRSKSSTSTAKSTSPCESVTSEDDTRSVESADLSPRTVDASETLTSVFPVDDSAGVVPVLPTSLHEAPLTLGCEELAIFCSLMTFDTSHGISRSRKAHVATRHQYSIV